MATTAESGGGEVLRSERIAGGILPKVLNTFDMIAIFVAIVLFISNAGVIPGAGAAAYIYWMLGLVTSVGREGIILYWHVTGYTFCSFLMKAIFSIPSFLH